ncbi:MAG TPA: DinB family protein [Acidimicrobiales bacterium]|nr:DinB family protein [Acidimicrobiales bacterium]
MTLPGRTPGGELGAPYDTMQPPDAAVALRSLPRRWRTALRLDDEDLATRQPDAGTWSALEHAAHVRGALERAARQLRSVRGGGQPELMGAGRAEEPWQGHDPAEGLAAVLYGLTAAAEAAAAEVEAAPGSAWVRTGTLDGHTVDLLWLARHAVSEGVEHLTAAESALAAARAAANRSRGA